MTTKESTTAPDAVETPVVTTKPEPTFADFDVHPDIVASLAEAGIIHPFPIQSMTLAVALGGHDIIGQAKTGTGKTLGFGIPMIQRVISPKDDEFATLKSAGKPQALAVAPTRELAVQVSGDLERAGKARGVRVLTIYGGRAFEPQIQGLQRGVEIVVGTPGSSSTSPSRVTSTSPTSKSVVLDEADEMLEPRLPSGHREDPRDDTGQPPDDALLSHHAGRHRRAGPSLHDPAHPHPGHGRRPGQSDGHSG